MLPKLSVAGDLSYSIAGKLFHTRGPATCCLCMRAVRKVGTSARCHACPRSIANGGFHLPISSTDRLLGGPSQRSTHRPEM